ncbi:MAG: serine/threonine protein kinase [Sandaracinaceae bacterium]
MARARCSTVVGGTYQIRHLLSRAPHASVFRAYHRRTGRKVVIKRFAPEHSEGPLGRRALREARIASQLGHPHVVAVVDMGRENDGSLYVVFEDLRGRTLESLLRDHGRLGPREALSLLLPIVDACADAHAQGVMHGAIDPSHIVVVESAGTRSAKLIGFGRAVSLEMSHDGAAHDERALRDVLILCLTGRSRDPACPLGASGLLDPALAVVVDRAPCGLRALYDALRAMTEPHGAIDRSSHADIAALERPPDSAVTSFGGVAIAPPPDAGSPDRLEVTIVEDATADRTIADAAPDALSGPTTRWRARAQLRMLEASLMMIALAAASFAVGWWLA